MSNSRKKKSSNTYHSQPQLDHRILMLEELFLHGAPVNNTTLRGGKQAGKLSNECLQYIIHRNYQDWKTSQIADSLGIKTGGVNTELTSFRNSAAKFYDAKIVVRISAPGDQNGDKFLCRIHGEQFVKASDANNHCWSVIFDKHEVVDGVAL